MRDGMGLWRGFFQFPVSEVKGGNPLGADGRLTGTSSPTPVISFLSPPIKNVVLVTSCMLPASQDVYVTISVDLVSVSEVSGHCVWAGRDSSW